VRGKRFLTVLGAGVVGLAAVGWFCRDDLKARYYTSRLLAAADDEAADWAERAGSWGGVVPARLLDGLRRDDVTACERCGAALARLARAWPHDDPRRATLIRQVAGRWGALSPPGTLAALDCAAALAEDRPSTNTAVQQLTRMGLEHADAAVRQRAAVLALRPEVGASEALVRMLNDPAAEVRRVALLAVGPSRALIADDDLLPWLHDPDAEVRRLCETALRSRGLRAKDVRIGRLLTNPQPSARLQLLALLADDGELDLGIWLQRLSRDASPAVRAAAVRLAGEQQVIPLAERISQMAQADPDLTVRRLAQYHLGQLQAMRPAGGGLPDLPNS
jgi:hypothetical protein